MGGPLMIIPSVFLALAGVLFLLLLLFVIREEVQDRATLELDDQTPGECRYAVQHPRLVLRLFSPEDREFISRLHSPRLQRIYEVERRRVALHWVRRTSRDVSKIMLNHRLATRQSPNLDVTREVVLFFQYVELRIICGLLIAFIGIFGPHILGDLAAHASELYRSIGQALPDTASVSPVASSSNPGTH
jgi:hypothetical protein